MRRNIDLIKWILGALESFEAESAVILTPSDVPTHLRPSESELSGLARGEPSFSGWALTGLTWDGHDFLDNSRDSRVWKAAKDAAGRFSFGVFTATLAEAAKAAALKALEKAF